MNVRLLVFARAPVPGATKTRLAPALGSAGAARLHEALVRHALEAAVAANAREVQLWCAGDDRDQRLARLAAATGAVPCRQHGADLGARMATALAVATADGVPAMVIGTDCPWLDAAVLRDAAQALDAGDAVLGPALDGGYVLLGLHRVAASLFEDIAWGTTQVLAETRARLRALGWTWRELDARPDVDRPDDLVRLAALGPPWSELCIAPRPGSA